MNCMLNICFVCDQMVNNKNSQTLNDTRNDRLHRTSNDIYNGRLENQSSIFQKLNIKITNHETNGEAMLCGNCTIILDQISALHNELNLLLYLVRRQIKRKYKGNWHSLDEEDQPNIDLLNKLDLRAVKSFKLLSNDYVCMKCSFRTPFQDTLVPHFKFHIICEKMQDTRSIHHLGVNKDNFLVGYDSDYEDELEADNVIVSEVNDLIVEEPIESVITELSLPESLKMEQILFVCPWCKFKDPEYNNITQHIDEMHSEGNKNKYDSCHNCGSSLESNGSCTHQKAIEKGFKPQKCSKCHEKFYMDHLLQDHSRRIHLKCDICNKSYSTFKILRQHEYSHKNGATYKCSFCDKKFKTRTGLVYHLPKHTGNYLCYCNICSKGFMSAKILEDHIRIHTKIHNYMCDICGVKFIHNSTYRIHRLWHDNPLPYNCTDCGKKFNHTSKLAVHRRRVHTGERPYKCDAEGCPKTFFETTTLRSHQRTHAQVVTHKCHICNLSFNSKTEYIQHMQKTHSRRPNLPKRTISGYKMVLKPEYRAKQMITTDSCKPINESDTDENLHINMIEEISNDDTKSDDSYIYKMSI